MQFYQVSIPLHLQASLALSIETDELAIPAGLQDRVIQAYQGLVYMDFSREKMKEEDGLRYGEYERLDPRLLPPLYLSFSRERSEPTEVTHGNLRLRYQQGVKEVVEAMGTFAELAVRARQALLNGDHEGLGRLMDANFDLRRRIVSLAPKHIEMIETARAAGATAKFAGSGGAILGTFRDERMFQEIERAMACLGCSTFKPRLLEV
jgi:glucuronokinase